MSLSLQVISTDFRRANVKVNQGTFLIDVLEEACKRLNLSSDKFLLKYKNKQLELSNPVRAYNLSPGAKLELVVKSNSPTVVTVALKLPDGEAAPNGGRLVEKFRSDTTLWRMLRHFESGSGGQGRKLNFTARGIPQAGSGNTGAGQLYYEGPILRVMGRELSSLADFQKTLSQLGLTGGNVLMQLSFKATGLTLHEAMGQMEEFFKEVEQTPSPDPGAAGSVLSAAPKSAASTEASAAATPIPSQTSEPPQVSEGESRSNTDADGPQAPQGSQTELTADVTTTTGQPENNSILQYRPVQVFAAPMSSTPAAALTSEPDTVYQPTIAHAQLHQQRLQQNSQNRRLPSDREIEERTAAEAAKIAAVKEVSIKVRFPDNTAAQWTFGPGDTGASLYSAVRSVMAHPDQPFKLVSPAAVGTAAPKGEIRDEGASGDEKHSLTRGYRLEGRVLATVVWADAVSQSVRKQPFLKQSAASRAQQIPIPSVPRDGEPQPPPKPSKSRSGDDGSSSGVKLPKWLKLPGKK